MKNFTIRIFFPEGKNSVEEYFELNAVMLGNGFQITIASDSGRKYLLPPGEYSFQGDTDRKILLEKVQAAAGQVGKKYAVLITESKGRTWFNLKLSESI